MNGQITTPYSAAGNGRPPRKYADLAVPYTIQPAANVPAKMKTRLTGMSATPNSRSHETCPIEADEIEQADTLAAREPPEQRQASGVDQCSVHRQPRLGVVPRSRRGSQNENGGDHGLRLQT